MTKHVWLVALAAAACAPGEREGAEATPTATPMDLTDVGFAVPEAARHDAAADVYLVSNINGEPVAKDGNGFISRISPAGEVLALKWIDGAADGVTLNAPKGMAFRGDTLFVADIDVVRLFDRNTGAPVGDWPLEGAAFLNDIAVGPDGTVYVTDTGVEPSAEAGGLVPNGRDGVYRRDGDAWVAVATGGDLGNPNGILADADGLTVVTFVSGEIYRLNPATGERTMLPKPAQGGLDGVLKLPDGSLLIGSWGAQGVYRLSPAGTFSVVTDTIASPASIGYDATRGVLMVPDFVGDRVLVRPVR